MRNIVKGLLTGLVVVFLVSAPVSVTGAVEISSSRQPNELGEIPILEFHVLAKKDAAFARTREHFRQDLLTLWNDGFVTVPLNAVLDRKIVIPKGLSPVVLTFDDSSNSQFNMIQKNGKWEVDSKCALGILMDFAAKHPGFGTHATFYINAGPFGQPAREQDKLKYLVQHGMEIGNHTYNHVPLRKLSSVQIQNELGQLKSLVDRLMPNYTIRSVAYPLGSVPHNIQDAVRGKWKTVSYHNEAGLLVGSNPAPSPYSTKWDPMRLPRIQAGDEPFQATYWLKILREHPKRVYVSDGDPNKVAKS